MNGVDSMKKIF